MYVTLFTIIVASFLALLFLNIYFRVKVLKHYKYLVQNRVEFPAKYILDKNKMETEVLPKYPEHGYHINLFAQNIRNSVVLAAGLLILIAILGAVINRF
jgi:hypothetical protein